MAGTSDAAKIILPAHAMAKGGNDVIYAWLARYQEAKKRGEDVVNGTIGALLDDDGELILNSVVGQAINDLPDLDKGAYSPLPGLPSYREISQKLAIGPRINELKEVGMHTCSVASPGGCGALYMSARNLLTPGDSILVRSTFWGPYRTIAEECGLELDDWPLVGSESTIDENILSSKLENHAKTQGRVLAWLNDPAHNPTGMSLKKNEQRQVLSCFKNAAKKFPNAGFTLLLDTAYALYSERPHGWTDLLIEEADDWPTNLLICWAFSASKSHTIYGLRCGALIMAHPDSNFVDSLVPMLVHTGRGTWSGTPRMPQAVVSMIHESVEREISWDAIRAGLSEMLTQRRKLLLEAGSGLPFDPSHDGYFAHISDSNPVELCEAIAERGVYVVPLSKGVRIGVCSLPTDKAARAGKAIAEAWKSLGRAEG
jgi:aspartate/tyrosine/aromatic aminotransferase